MFQFMLPGAASIYYGDEAAIDGTLGTNEGCRYPMPWGTDFTKGEAYKLHRTLAHLKAEHTALRRGGMKFLYAENHVVSIARFWEDEVFVMVVSTADEDQTIRLPLGIVGAACPEGGSDVFGRALRYEKLDENSIAFTVEAHRAYFLECRLR